MNEAKEIVQASGLMVGEGDAKRPAKIEDLAVSFGMRDVGADSPPVVVGCSTLAQVRSEVTVTNAS